MTIIILCGVIVLMGIVGLVGMHNDHQLGIEEGLLLPRRPLTRRRASAQRVGVRHANRSRPGK